MAGRDVFLTGGTGFIGKHFLNKLKDCGRSVRCLARPTSSVEAIEKFGCEIVTGNLNDIDSLTKAIEGCKVVFHVAGKSRNATRGDMAQTNVEGTRNIAIACQRQPSPPILVFVSSLAAAGPTTIDHPLVETDPCNPVSKYGESKLAAEEVLRTFSHEVPISIIRPPIVFGEEDTVTLDLFKVINRYRVYLRPGLVDKAYSLIHADDLVNSALAIESNGCRLSANDHSSGTYFVGYPNIFTGSEFAKAVGKAIDRNPFILPIPHCAVNGIAAANEIISKTTPWKPFLNWDKAREVTAGSWISCVEKLIEETNVELSLSADRFSQTAEGYRRKGWL